MPLSDRTYFTQHLTPFAPVSLINADLTKTATFRKPASPSVAAIAAKMMAVSTLHVLNRLISRQRDSAIISLFDSRSLTVGGSELLAML
ncbi:hypothetical protein [Burkholderia sp. WP9]|uniref:hypothetical protein n=1 Tax=Burkholderia sp. WP9 TaxID=1500263 RepID=UPI000B88754D|nr:hypothetical protein [Burkholderia sp. WP9]